MILTHWALNFPMSLATMANETPELMFRPFLPPVILFECLTRSYVMLSRPICRRKPLNGFGPKKASTSSVRLSLPLPNSLRDRVSSVVSASEIIAVQGIYSVEHQLIIFIVMRMQALGRPAPKTKGERGKMNTHFYCERHRDIGHKTEDCQNLEDEIESLIRQNYLQRYV